MLPERRKRLILTIVGIVLFVLLVVSIFAISMYVKDNTETNKDIDDRANSNYPSEYYLYGITVDMDNILRIYGINDNYVEKYLGVRSFYKNQGNMEKDNHLFLYVDCVNELRYDAKDREFYLYKYDDYYSNNTKFRITKNYLVMFDKYGNVTLREYNSDDIKTILSDVLYDNTTVKGNTLYYADNIGIHRYNLSNNVKEDLVTFIEFDRLEDVKFLDINDNYMAYTKSDGIYIYSNNLKYSKSLDIVANITDLNVEDINYLEITNDGFYFQIPNDDGTFSVLKYNLISNRLEEEKYVTKFKIIKMDIINSNLCYMDILMDGKEESILFSLKIGDIVKKLENKYTYITSLEE